MKKIKIAVAGLGRVGFSRHVQAPANHEHFEVIACMDKSTERLYEARDLYDLNVYDDFHEMVDQEKDADLIVIASPTHFHFEQAMYALSKGKDVFLEKPMTVTLNEAIELVKTAKRLNKKIMLHQQHRIFDSTIALLDGLSKDLIGDIFRVNYNISGYTVRNDWQALKKYGGGMLYNYGAHFVDLFLYVFNPTVTKVFCKTDKILSVGDAEDVVKIILQTKEKITYDLDINMASTVKHPKWVVYGKKGSIIIDDNTMTIKYLKDDQALKLQLQTTLAAKNRKYDNTGDLQWDEQVIPLSNYGDIQYYDKVYEFFALGKTPLVSIDQSLQVMEILNECENQ